MRRGNQTKGDTYRLVAPRVLTVFARGLGQALDAVGPLATTVGDAAGQVLTGCDRHETCAQNTAGNGPVTFLRLTDVIAC